MPDRTVKRKDSDEDQLSDDDFSSAEDVAPYQTEQMQEGENTIEERLQNTQDSVIISD